MMKSKILLLLSLAWMHTLSAQLVISSGAQFNVSGNMQLTLENTHFINNGVFTAGTGKVSFTGNASSSISGSQPVQLFVLEMNKINNSSVILQRSVAIGERILFNGGLLDLNGFTIDLGSAAFLENEKETSRITGINGGQVVCNAVLDAPSAANPGNLGAIISSSQNIGNVIIKRGHQSQANSYGNGSSIFRYYDISPANNNGLNATLRFNYYDAELNGINENSLVFYRTDNGTNWAVQGFSSRDTVADFVEKTTIPSFSRWTLSGFSNALPVQYTLFNVRCVGNKVIIIWKTAQEQNSSHFDIERSMNGASWTAIGTLPAAGNSAYERSYSFTDNHPVQSGYYRLAQYDLDGKVQYTSVLRTACNSTDVFTFWPNPSSGVIFVNINTPVSSPAGIKVFDSKGALVKMHKATLLPGSNQFSLDLGTLAKGVYTLYAEWNNGEMKKAVHVVKN